MLEQFFGFSSFMWLTCLGLAEIIDDMNWATQLIPSKRKICTEKNSLFLGHVTKDDEVIFETEVEMKGEPGKILEHTLHFPEKNGSNTKKINFILAMDCDHSAEGETPVLRSGGINTTHVTIGLKSKKGKNLDYLVMIRGRDPTLGIQVEKPTPSRV